MTRFQASAILKDPECQRSPMPLQCELLPVEPVCREPEGPSFMPAPEPPLCDRASPFDAFSLEDGSFDALEARLQGMPMANRLECISRRFLALPYAPDPLGEGESGDADRDPLFRFDALDCMTYVEEVIAAARGEDGGSFLSALSAIRYRGDEERFGLRNHFVEGDWIPNNARRGIVRDITSAVGGSRTQAMQITIDRARWVGQRTELTNKERSAVLFDLWESGVDAPQEVAMRFIPLSAFLLHAGTRRGISRQILEALPEVSIAVFLRHQDAAQRIGVMVAHMGFLIVPRDCHGLPMAPILRHASSAAGAIVDEPLDLYLEENASRRAGVALLQIVD